MKWQQLLSDIGGTGTDMGGAGMDEGGPYAPGGAGLKIEEVD